MQATLEVLKYNIGMKVKGEKWQYKKTLNRLVVGCLYATAIAFTLPTLADSFLTGENSEDTKRNT